MLYDGRPADWKADFQAVGCFVEVEGFILQLLRSEKCGIEPKKWGVPGGKIQMPEMPMDAMIRELREETGLVVVSKQLRLLDLFYVAYPAFDFEYYVFKLFLPFRPEIVLSLEHTANVWIKPEDANSLHLMQDELECIKLVYYR